MSKSDTFCSNKVFSPRSIKTSDKKVNGNKPSITPISIPHNNSKSPSDRILSSHSIKFSKPMVKNNNHANNNKSTYSNFVKSKKDAVNNEKKPIENAKEKEVSKWESKDFLELVNEINETNESKKSEFLEDNAKFFDSKFEEIKHLTENIKNQLSHNKKEMEDQQEKK